MARDKPREKRPGGSFRIVTGAAMVLLSLIYLADRTGQPLTTGFEQLAIRFLFATLLYLGCIRFTQGLYERILAYKLEKLKILFEGVRRVPLSAAAAYMQCSRSKLVQDVRTLQRREFVYGMYADLIRRDLVYLGAGAMIDPPPPPDEGGVTLSERQKKSALPFYMAGAVWVAYAVWLPLYRPLDFVIVTILSVIAYLRCAWSVPPRVIIVETQPEPVKWESTGNDMLDEMLASVGKHVDDLRRLDVAITGKLDEPVRDILRTTEQIVEHLRKNPSTAGQMRQFFNYTLPTTISLLQNYDELSRQSVRSDSIKGALIKIEGMIDTIVAAFHRQLDSLFRDRALDIEVELDVMREMLNQGSNNGTSV